MITSNIGQIIIEDSKTSIGLYEKEVENTKTTVIVETPFLKGKDGTNGTDGTDGVNGKSTYQIAVDSGFVGTEQEWLDSLNQDKFYTHDQMTPSNTWTINHNLNKFPSITVVDSAGTRVFGDVQYITSNQVVCSFSAGFTGKAYLN